MKQEKKMYQRPEFYCHGSVEEITLHRNRRGNYDRSNRRSDHDRSNRRGDHDRPNRKRGGKHSS